MLEIITPHLIKEKKMKNLASSQNPGENGLHSPKRVSSLLKIKQQKVSRTFYTLIPSQAKSGVSYPTGNVPVRCFLFTCTVPKQCFLFKGPLPEKPLPYTVCLFGTGKNYLFCI